MSVRTTGGPAVERACFFVVVGIVTYHFVVVKGEVPITLIFADCNEMFFTVSTRIAYLAK